MCSKGSQKPPHPNFHANINNREDPSEFRRQTYHAKSWDIYLLFSANGVILPAVVLSQYTRVSSQTMTDRRQTILHVLFVISHVYKGC